MSGPFEELGSEAFIPLGVLLVVISLIDVVAGRLLWRGRRIGAWIGLATDPIAFGLGLGFALPLLLIGMPVRAVLTVFGWRRAPPAGTLTLWERQESIASLTSDSRREPTGPRSTD